MEKQIGILISDELGGALCTTSGLGPRAADAPPNINRIFAACVEMKLRINLLLD
jgi:hypothetical protein